MFNNLKKAILKSLYRKISAQKIVEMYSGQTEVTVKCVHCKKELKNGTPYILLPVLQDDAITEPPTVSGLSLIFTCPEHSYQDIIISDAQRYIALLKIFYPDLELSPNKHITIVSPRDMTELN